MNVKNIRSKKALKFLGLLISAMVIATVSAQIYDFMNLNATVGVQGIDLAWVLGPDNATAGTQIEGLTASLNNLNGPPNGTRIYYDPLRLNNTGGSPVTFDLLIDEVSGDTAEMDSIYVRLYRVSDNASMGNLTVWSGGSEGSDLMSRSIAQNAPWRFQWEITWKAIATTETVTVKLKVRTIA